MSEADFMQWGWRIPFISSAFLVIVGFWIRLKLHETPAFQKVLNKQKEVNIPFKEVITKHWGMLDFRYNCSHLYLRCVLLNHSIRFKLGNNQARLYTCENFLNFNWLQRFALLGLHSTCLQFLRKNLVVKPLQLLCV